jgi:pyruvate,water dikinase
MTPPAVYANLSVPARAVEAAAAGVEGIGLMRSEFLVYRTGRHPRLLVNDAAPNDLQTILADAMRRVCEAMQPRPVLYRSLDLRSNEVMQLVGGADFETVEENPALGCRGMSRSRRDSDVFAVELKALRQVRAEGFDNLRFMLPFVRWPEEVEWAREQLEAGASSGSPPELWMMVETPSSVLRAAEFAPLIDGVSIGSNDLSQFILALDRDNVAFARHDWDSDPAIIAGLRIAAQQYQALGVQVGICGDAPSRSESLLRMLCDWGLTSISVSLDRVAALKDLLAEQAVEATITEGRA